MKSGSRNKKCKLSALCLMYIMFPYYSYLLNEHNNQLVERILLFTVYIISCLQSNPNTPAMIV